MRRSESRCPAGASTTDRRRYRLRASGRRGPGPSSPPAIRRSSTWAPKKASTSPRTAARPGRRQTAGLVTSVVWRVVPDPSSPSILYAATSAGIFKTADGGATWSMILPGGRGSVVMAPSSPSTLYAWTSAGLFRTDDGGADWTRLPAGGTRHPARWCSGRRRQSRHRVRDRGGGGGTRSDGSSSDPPTAGTPGARCRGASSNSGGESSRPIRWIPLPCSPPGGAAVLKSTDAGATWTVVSPEEWANGVCKTLR